MKPGGALSASANPYVPETFDVVGRRRETDDTVTLRLRPRNGRGFAFRPGQFTMIYAFGVGEVPISVSGSPERPEVLEHTIRAVGAVTRRLVGLTVGDWVGVRGPLGHGWPLEEAKGRDLLIVAGGLGMAPLRPAVLRVLAHRSDYGRVIVLYGTRTPADLLYARELERWRGRLDVDVQVTVDRADPTWRGNIGVVPALFSQIGGLFQPANTTALLCGPEVMMRFTVRELQRRAVSDHDIYLTLERNMKCGLGLCGHCQYGPHFICKDGPVFAYSRISSFFEVREI